MARDEHNIAAELRENVAKAHRKDPAKGHEHANTAKQQSQTATSILTKRTPRASSRND